MNQIPKSFKLLSHTIKVEIVDHDRLCSNNVGLACYSDHKIILRSGKDNGENLETFFHEVMHFVLRHIGITKQDGTPLYTDEVSVDLMGEMMAQIISTMEYQEDR